MTARRVFFGGLSISIVLLTLCAYYAFSPEWRANFEMFFSPTAGYVGSPPIFRYLFLLFVVLNLPGVIVGAILMYVVEVFFVFDAGERVRLAFGILLLSSVAWWWSAARAVVCWRKRVTK